MSTQDGTYDFEGAARRVVALLTGDGDEDVIRGALKGAFEAGAVKERECDTCGGTKVIYSDPAEGNPSLNGEDEVAMSCPDCDALAEARASAQHAGSRCEVLTQERDTARADLASATARVLEYHAWWDTGRRAWAECDAAREAAEADARATRAHALEASRLLSEIKRYTDHKPTCGDSDVDDIHDGCDCGYDVAIEDVRAFLAATPPSAPAGTGTQAGERLRDGHRGSCDDACVKRHREADGPWPPKPGDVWRYRGIEWTFTLSTGVTRTDAGTERHYWARSVEGSVHNFLREDATDGTLTFVRAAPVTPGELTPKEPSKPFNMADEVRKLTKPRTTVKRFAAELKVRIAKVEAAFAKPGQEQFVAGASYIKGVVDALLSDFDVRDPEDYLRAAVPVEPKEPTT